MVLPKIALKNLGRQKRRTVLLGGAIAFGVMIMFLVSGLSQSMFHAAEQNISQLFSGHLFLIGTEKTASGRYKIMLKNDEILLEAMKKAGVEYNGISRRTTQQRSNIIFGKDNIIVNLSGIDWPKEPELAARLQVTAGDLKNVTGTQGLVIAETVAKKLNVQIHDQVTVQVETSTGQQNVGDLTVEAIFKDPDLFGGSLSAYADIKTVNTLLNLQDGEYTRMGVGLKEPARADELGKKLAAQMEKDGIPLFAKDNFQNLMKAWQEQYWEGTKYSILTINDFVPILVPLYIGIQVFSFFILFVLFLVIMVGIVNTYRMIVYERTKEIGTLRALGMQRSQVRGLFLLEALFLSLGGLVSGVIAATLIALGLGQLNLSNTGLLDVFLNNGRFGFEINPILAVLVFVLVAGLTLLAALFPARRAALMSPAEALRTTL